MQTAQAQAIARRPVLRILLVEPSAEDARSVRDLLEGDPEVRVHATRNPTEAPRLLAEGAFDAALVDAALWVDDSTELLCCFREHHPDVAVVLLTSGENDREALPALKLGAHDFVSRRSLDRDQLMTRIVAAVDESRASRRRDTMVRWLEREARTDHLTGLYNRRAFDESLDELCARARDAAQPVTLILVNVTGTGTVNEVHGHEAGDSMIRRAAAGLSRAIRGRDFAARVGGDDFAVIVQRADLEQGRMIARRIAHVLDRLNANEWLDEIPVAVTFGVASAAAATGAELLAAAERQLAGRHALPRAVAQFHFREEDDGPSVA